MTRHGRCLGGTTTMFLRALGLFGALTLASVPRPAQAQEDSKVLARRHFDRGIELAGEAAYAEALVEFMRAHEISPHYAVLYNIGQAYVALGRPVEAVDALTRYLAQGGAEVPSERRRQVEDDIARQKARIAEIEVRTDVPGAVVTMNGREIGKTPLAGPIKVAIGTYRIAANVPGRSSVEQSVTVAGEEKRRIDIAIPAAAAAVPAVSPTLASPAAKPSRDDASEERPSQVQSTLGYVAGAVGIGLAGATVAHYVWNKDRYDTWSARHRELRDEKGESDYAARQGENNELSDSIDRASIVTVGLGIGAGVMLGTGVVLVATAPSAPSDRVGTGGIVTWQGVW